MNVIELSKTKSARQIAEDLGVGKTQIQNILKRKIELISDYENNAPGDRKRIRRCTGNEDVNDLVLSWFKDAVSRRVPVSGPLLMEKAMIFASDLGNTQFKGSQGWLQSFVKRNNITFGTMTGERGDVSTTTVEEWKEKLPTICRDYQPKDIFNMDETGLFFKDTTKKSFHFKGDDCSARKRSKERITVDLTASMTGEKLTPVVIGKSSQPRCFKNIKTDKLPVTYRNNRKSWMATELMINWLRTVDRDMRKAHHKIILFLDNAPVDIVLRDRPRDC
ncbi:tigger transposable element-derived protein 4-like [Mercenaria mercenaria]|uniref:tigger transposable element-derived protein 4-like n=1 Tax=Mercenaria mercenaria TaxID=6596 RepID=UPI00234EEF78|nr:tigger transposable element-derived protein 4-like [Mercenaria mercenaria]